MRAGGEKRGNSYARRARKNWMLNSFGNGMNCHCVHCNAILTYDSVEADRIIPGASYRRENIQPSCRFCNLSRSNNREWQYATA